MAQGRGVGIPGGRPRGPPPPPPHPPPPPPAGGGGASLWSGVSGWSMSPERGGDLPRLQGQVHPGKGCLTFLHWCVGDRVGQLLE